MCTGNIFWPSSNMPCKWLTVLTWKLAWKEALNDFWSHIEFSLFIKESEKQFARRIVQSIWCHLGSFSVQTPSFQINDSYWPQMNNEDCRLWTDIWDNFIDFSVTNIYIVTLRSYSCILIGSGLWSIRGQMHDWRHHYKVFPSVF